ncbi:MAG: hypothetical protein QXI09_03500 [Candidatus Aenigmatarchaeota archaeon]
MIYIIIIKGRKTPYDSIKEYVEVIEGNTYLEAIEKVKEKYKHFTFYSIKRISSVAQEKQKVLDMFIKK